MRPVSVGIGRRCAQLVVLVGAGLLFAGCGGFSKTVPVDLGQPLPPAVDSGSPRAAFAAEDAAEPTAPLALAMVGPSPDGPPPAGAETAPTLIAQSQPRERSEDANGELEQYDPWERFNEKMFDFNIKLDKYVLKPVARAYRAVVPDQVQLMIDNGFDNIRFVPRLINNLLQGKVHGAVSELTRFILNSTIGFGGLFDAAKHAGIERRGEDFGQTLGVWGAGPGPYLVLPLIEPMTVRDGIGRGVDSFLDPLGYFIPFFPTRLLMKVEDTINERALNYDLFQGVEETTLDLYSSVRHFYLNRREKQIRE